MPGERPSRNEVLRYRSLRVSDMCGGIWWSSTLSPLLLASMDYGDGAFDWHERR